MNLTNYPKVSKDFIFIELRILFYLIFYPFYYNFIYYFIFIKIICKVKFFIGTIVESKTVRFATHIMVLSKLRMQRGPLLYTKSKDNGIPP